ncbi:flagellar hook-associated protein FlgK [Microbacterium sp. NPDC090007]|uniref:flagellar hook-associated protein FlgK n=1 Tax=Microbacterium sp. NPDC090007 TaxID=3364204 RepID=UPI00382426A2
MSTFSGLQVAASGLAAARAGMNLTGQNIANETTPGYTRQRLEQTAVSPAGTASAWARGIGGGVSIDGVARLGDEILDARVRDALSASGLWSVRAAAAAAVEKSTAEPSTDGLSAGLGRFWAAWSDLANTPEPATAQVVLTDAGALAARIAAGYDEVAGQWSATRDQLDRDVAAVNVTAAQVAALNGQIRSALQSERGANELIDQRNLLAQKLSAAVGATGRVEDDGTMTLRVDGNALVAGDTSRSLSVSGPRDMTTAGPITLAWVDRPDLSLALTGGSVGGTIGVLAPAAEQGTLAVAARAYDEVAVSLAQAVNEVHRGGRTASGVAGGDVFTFAAGVPAARGLRVAITAVDQLALSAPGAGPKDTSVADRLSQLDTSTTGPDAAWSRFVVGFGVSVAGDLQRADAADRAAIAALSGQQSTASVDGDEETITLLTYQTAYQAAARVLTAVDEALDVLINRVGLVGR